MACCEDKKSATFDVPPVGPQPNAMWNGMASWYSSTLAAANVPLAHSLIAHLGDLNTDTVLETHHGDGRVAEFLLQLFPNVKYMGCDFSSAMADLCRARCDRFANVKLWEGDSMDLSAVVEDGSVGAYLSNLGGCCVQDLGKMMTEAKRVLRVGGRAALSLRNEGSPSDTFFRLIVEALQPFGYPEYAKREGLWIGHDPACLRQRALDCGFSSAIAWTAVIPLPVFTTSDFLELASSMGGVRAVLAKLEPEQREKALAALGTAASDAINRGSIQIAAGCVVAVK